MGNITRHNGGWRLYVQVKYDIKTTPVYRNACVVLPKTRTTDFVRGARGEIIFTLENEAKWFLFKKRTYCLSPLLFCILV